MIFAAPPPPLWMPERPAIIRAAHDLSRHYRRAIEAKFGVKLPTMKAMLPGIGGIIAGLSSGPPLLTAAYQGSTTGNGSTVTYTSAPFGAVADAGDTRYIVVVTGAVPATTITSVTIGGITATLVISCTTGVNVCGIYIAAVPTGTSGNVVIVYGAGSDAGIGVYRMINPSSATASATATDISPSSNVLNLDTNIVSGGVAIGITSHHGGQLTAWSGLTEDFDILINQRFSGALGTTAGTPRTITATQAAAGSSYIGCVAAWSP